MAETTITIKISAYEKRMLYDMKDRVDKLNDGELSLAGDILLSNLK
jgi:hypothetical protein